LKFLSAEQVLFIHARVISETGGSHGLRDIGLLQSAVARPNATFDGEELYSSTFEKAAALMHSLIKNHPFIDGNKRVGVLSAIVFLNNNNIIIEARNDDLINFTLSVVNDLQLNQIAEWFEKHQS